MSRRAAPAVASAVLALAVLAGCAGVSEDAAAPTTTEAPTTTSSTTEARTLTEPSTVGGARPVEVQVPSGYDPAVPAPLLVVLHGYGVDGAIQAAYLRLGPAADEAGMLLVAPDGTPGPDGQRYWSATDACCGPDEGAPDDVAYLTGIIDEVAERYAVDPRRVFLVGHSNGGFMAFRLACEAADRIAAIASIAGATTTDAEDCRPSEPVAVLAVHGTADDTILYDGGRIAGTPYPSAAETASRWAELNGCDPSARPIDDSPTLVEGQAAAEVQVHDGCDAGGWVERWTLPDGVHIPAFTDAIGEELIAFLEAHPKP